MWQADIEILKMYQIFNTKILYFQISKLILDSNTHQILPFTANAETYTHGTASSYWLI
jgi:hypothetical protein